MSKSQNNVKLKIFFPSIKMTAPSLSRLQIIFVPIDDSKVIDSIA